MREERELQRERGEGAAEPTGPVFRGLLPPPLSPSTVGLSASHDFSSPPGLIVSTPPSHTRARAQVEVVSAELEPRRSTFLGRLKPVSSRVSLLLPPSETGAQATAPPICGWVGVGGNGRGSALQGCLLAGWPAGQLAGAPPRAPGPRAGPEGGCLGLPCRDRSPARPRPPPLQWRLRPSWRRQRRAAPSCRRG